MTYVTLGWVLHEMRMRAKITLRDFCNERGLDPLRFSQFERDALKPTSGEALYYMELAIHKLYDGLSMQEIEMVEAKRAKKRKS